MDTAGAGDTFVSAFSVACEEGNGIGVCMNFATRAVSINVRRMGAQAGTP